MKLPSVGLESHQDFLPLPLRVSGTPLGHSNTAASLVLVFFFVALH